MKTNKTSTVFVSVFMALVGLILFTAQSVHADAPVLQETEESKSVEKFCKIANTSIKGRTQTEIDEYYEQLSSVAPDTIKAYVKLSYGVKS